MPPGDLPGGGAAEHHRVRGAGRLHLADDGPRPVTLERGFVANFATVLFDRHLGFEVSAIDTVVMGEDGLAPLSTLPRELEVLTG